MPNERSAVAVICPVRCPGWEAYDSDLPDRLRGELTVQTFHELLQSGVQVYAVVGSQGISGDYCRRLDWMASHYHGRLHLLEGPTRLVHQLQHGIERATHDGAEILALMSPENAEANLWLSNCLPPLVEGWCEVVVPSRDSNLISIDRYPTNLIRCERWNNDRLNRLLNELGLREPGEVPWDAWSGAVVLRNDPATRRYVLANWDYARRVSVDFMDSWPGSVLLPTILARRARVRVRVANVSFGPSARTRDSFAAEAGAVSRCQHLGNLMLDMVRALHAGLEGGPSPLTWTLPILGAD